MRALVALLLLLCLGSPLLASDWAATITKVDKSVLFIESGCSAFVIDATRKYVLTAAHCDDKDGVWIDRVKGQVIAKDGKKDLLVLYVEHLDPSIPALKLAAKNPERGQEVMACGFGYALDRAFFRVSRVQDDALMIPEDGIGGPFISTDGAFVGGQSGGPVVNLEGAVVAIVQRASNTIGIGVGAEIIRDRMGRFFGK